MAFCLRRAVRVGVAISASVLLGSFTPARAASFTPGNVVVYRVGNGTESLTASAAPVFLDEYTPAGVLVQSVALPTAVSGSNKRLTAAGASVSEGLLTRSTNGRYLVLMGYDAAVGTANVSTSAVNTVNRVVGRVDAAGTIDTTTALTDFSNAPYGAASTDGTNLWLTGANAGVRFTTRTATTSTQLNSVYNNLRGVGIFGGQLYVSHGTNTSPPFRIGSVGSGTPTTSGQSIQDLQPDVAITSPHAFFFADLSGTEPGVDTLYIADDSANRIRKYASVGGSWIQKGLILATNVRGLTGFVAGTTVQLFGTEGGSSSTLYGVTDTSGYNAAPSSSVAAILASADSNTAFRGVAMAPFNAPTAVHLVSFTAASGPDGVRLRWQTGWETGNLGFHLYREQDGLRTRITPSLVAGSALLAGSPSLLAGYSYGWTDPDPAGGAYVLEAVDLDGQSTLYGPVFPRLDAAASLPASPLLARAGSGGAVYAGPEPRTAPVPFNPAPVPPGGPLAGRAAVKLSVDHEGWYRLAQPELVAAGLAPDVDPASLRLYAEDREQAIRVTGAADGRFDPEDAVEFYGLGLDTPSTGTRVYWLVAGPGRGRRIPAPAVPPGAPGPASFPATVERRERTIYFAGVLNGDASNFFGPVVSTTNLVQTLPVAFPVPGRGGILTVELQGVSAREDRPDHRVAVSVNGLRLGQVVWDGRVRGTLTVPVPASLVRAGDNRLELWAESGGTDVSLVESLRLTYARRLTAEGGVLRCAVPGGTRVRLGGFGNRSVRVLDVTDPSSPVTLPFTVSAAGTMWTAQADVPGTPGQRRILYACDETAVQYPARIRANAPTHWLNGTGAAMLIVTPAEFREALAPLVALRRAGGLSVAEVDLEDVWDECGYGETDPAALRTFVAAARNRWARRPRYLLLAGKGTYDPRGYLGGDADRLPLRLVDTAVMETPSDDAFGDLDGDGLAEIAVGRLPARSAAELAAMVRKQAAYEAEGGGGRALFAVDQNDTFDFEAASASAAAGLPGYEVTQVRRGALGTAAARQQLLAGLAQGAGVVNYVGHGSTALWRGGLFETADAEDLRGSAGIWASMTCLNGYAASPTLPCLGEVLLRNPGGGAVAVWASSGQCDPAPQVALDREFLRDLARGATLGDAARTAKQATRDPDARRTWTLLGDPAMRLK